MPFPQKTRFYCVTGYQKRSNEARAVFRVERNRGYTVMSNHHLRNKELTLKAKGLLSQMLSLPEDWDYALAGLSHINRESIDAIRTAVWELEKAGYITRRQGRDEKGKMTAIEYTIYEQPQPPLSDNPALENPTMDVYADNANIIPEEIPELLFYMEEVMPDKSGNGDSENNIQDIMIDMDAYVPEKKSETIKSPDESHISMNSRGEVNKRTEKRTNVCSDIDK